MRGMFENGTIFGGKGAKVQDFDMAHIQQVVSQALLQAKAQGIPAKQAAILAYQSVKKSLGAVGSPELRAQVGFAIRGAVMDPIKARRNAGLISTKMMPGRAPLDVMPIMHRSAATGAIDEGGASVFMQPIGQGLDVHAGQVKGVFKGTTFSNGVFE